MAAKGSKRKKDTLRKLTAILCADVVGYFLTERGACTILIF